MAPSLSGKYCACYEARRSCARARLQSRLPGTCTAIYCCFPGCFGDVRFARCKETHERIKTARSRSGVSRLSAEPSHHIFARENICIEERNDLGNFACVAISKHCTTSPRRLRRKKFALPLCNSSARFQASANHRRQINRLSTPLLRG